MKVLKVLIIIALPLLLGLGTIRLLMSDAFVSYEYAKSNFPPDPFGFTQADRLNYTRVALQYITSTAPISLLGDETFPNGQPLYNERELRHMIDVQRLANALLIVTLAAGAVLVIGSAALALRPAGRRDLASALVGGAILTFLVLAALVGLMLFGWETFFVGFHELFFASGTWTFAYSDTLIRLFPEKFWFDVAILIGGGTLAEAAIIGVIAWFWHRRLEFQSTDGTIAS